MASETPYSSALSPEFALMGLLALRPAHGYELYHRLMNDLGQVWHISLSQTYNILNRLEARGWIVADVLSQAKLPPRRCFELTDAGRARFDAWLSAPTGSSVRAIRVEFITRLYFVQTLDPAQIGRLIDAQIDDVRNSLGRLERILAAIPADQTFNRLGVELRARQLISICDWLAGCRLAMASDAGAEA